MFQSHLAIDYVETHDLESSMSWKPWKHNSPLRLASWAEYWAPGATPPLPPDEYDIVRDHYLVESDGDIGKHVTTSDR
jgi:hypothetical protein